MLSPDQIEQLTRITGVHNLSDYWAARVLIGLGHLSMNPSDNEVETVVLKARKNGVDLREQILLAVAPTL
jgi:hypothetical protein